MKNIYVDYLFTKHILVADEEPSNQMETAIALASIFNIKIEKGFDLLNPKHLDICNKKFVTRIKYMNTSFYAGFPETVWQLSEDQLMLDQMFAYYRTYGKGDFSGGVRSIFEPEFERRIFSEECEITSFEVVTEEEAKELVREMVQNLLKNSRPINDAQYEFVKTYIRDAWNKEMPMVYSASTSVNTSIRLAYDLRNDLPGYYGSLKLPDVIKLVEYINYKVYGKTHINKLNLKNKDRKFITKVIRKLIELDFGCENLVNACFEKRKAWKGLLHHIHFNPKTDDEKAFVEMIRYGKKNRSVYSKVDAFMKKGMVVEAVKELWAVKGPNAVLRNLDYFLSRCGNNFAEINDIFSLDLFRDASGIVLLQLLNHYKYYETERRIFMFTRFNKLKMHAETIDEMRGRKPVSDVVLRQLEPLFEDRVRMHYESINIGNVYISEEMKRIAVPIQENTGEVGYGILTRGSRIPIPKKKVVRVFTYWEKVHDIDLSLMGIYDDGRVSEFSWRTMARNQSRAICYSGDVTDGYNGGSEYFDINLKEVRKMYPDLKYLLVCNNIYSSMCNSFKDCYCIAGYMTRDRISSGEIYEPKTVKSAYTINANSRFAYLFAIDLETNELVWLNLSRSENRAVAGSSRFNSKKAFDPYIYATDMFNVHDLFTYMATKVVDDPNEADIIVSDEVTIEGKKIIRSYDVEKMLYYLNQ